MISLNILDYSPIDEGANAREALLQTTTLAKRAEELGYHRYWVAEHHHVLSVAGSSPEMLMMHLATSTNQIRIGSGGIMLPHYSPRSEERRVGKEGSPQVRTGGDRKSRD